MVSPAPAVDTSVRLDRLTSLRYVAAIFVVGCHVSGFVGSRRLSDITDRWGTWLVFFFLLSGFVLTWSHRPQDSNARYYRRRVARVYPNHVVTWALALAIIYWTYGRQQPLSHTLASLVLVQAWVPHPSFYFSSNGVSWSLGVEAFMYALFPFAYVLLRRLRFEQRWWVLGASFLVLLLTPLSTQVWSKETATWFVFVLPVTQLPIFIIGMVLGLAYLEGWRMQVSVPAVVAAFVVFGAIAYALPAPWWRDFPAVIPFALLICFVVNSDLDRKPGFFTHPVFVRLGLWSYAVYLLHSLVIYVVEHYMDRLAIGWVKGPLLGVGILAAATVLAGLLHELVERPAEKWLRGAPPRRETAEELEHPLVH